MYFQIIFVFCIGQSHFKRTCALDLLLVSPSTMFCSDFRCAKRLEVSKMLQKCCGVKKVPEK